ncbi:MAG: hypothetical protein LBK42_06120 [Propionibacteriaceae bacterium]|nr:hypothetical protein [Propionibacteriaceae bacterium]
MVDDGEPFFERLLFAGEDVDAERATASTLSSARSGRILTASPTTSISRSVSTAGRTESVIGMKDTTGLLDVAADKASSRCVMTAE